MSSIIKPYSVFLAIVLYLGFASRLWARTLRVPGEYPDISAAITAAGAGDEIRLSPGVYKVNLDLKPQIRLMGEDVSATTLMPADGIAKPVITTADKCSIENLTVTKALAGSKAAILLRGNNALVRHNVITGNLTAAIAVEGGASIHTPLETSSVFERILHNKGAKIVLNSAKPIITNNRINSNSGSGILVTNASPVIEGNQICYNADEGISMVAALAAMSNKTPDTQYIASSQPQIRDNQILDNLGAAVMCESVSPVITGNTMRSKDKPCLLLFNSSAAVRKNRFTTSGMPAVQIDGGQSAPTIEDNIMAGSRRFPVLGESRNAVVRNNRIINEWSPGFGTDLLDKPAAPAKVPLK